GTCPARTGLPPLCGPERSGSTASSSATCAPRSAASATLASAARAVPSAASSSPSPRPWSCRSERRSCALVLPGQYEDGDLPGGPGLVLAERGMPRDQRRPQLGTGGVVKLLRHGGERLGTHLDRDAGVGLEIVVPGRVLG